MRSRERSGWRFPSFAVSAPDVRQLPRRLCCRSITQPESQSPNCAAWQETDAPGSGPCAAFFLPRNSRDGRDAGLTASLQKKPAGIAPRILGLVEHDIRTLEQDIDRSLASQNGVMPMLGVLWYSPDSNPHNEYGRVRDARIASNRSQPSSPTSTTNSSPEARPAHVHVLIAVRRRRVHLLSCSNIGMTRFVGPIGLPAVDESSARSFGEP